MAALSALDRAVRAARRGHPAAIRLLDAVLEDEPYNETALVWRAHLEDAPDIKAHRLRRVRNVNPDSAWATAALADLEATSDQSARRAALEDAVPKARPTSKTASDLDAPPRAPSVKHLQCTSCAGQIEVHPERGSKAAACTHCGSVLDLTSAHLAILGQVTPRWRPSRDIRPGAQAVLEGETHLVTGWLRYEGWDNEDRWRWDEWQLVSESGQIRYLSFDDEEGFTLQTPVRPTPAVDAKGIDLEDGRVRFHESSATRIIGMAGELTWRPRLDAVLRVSEGRRDGVLYSVETTANEVEVVAGRSMSEVEVWQALGRDDKIEQTRAHVARFRGRRRLMLQAAALSLVLGLVLVVLMDLEKTNVLSAPVASAEVSYEIEPVTLPTDVNERTLALFDTVEVMDVRLSSFRSYKLSVRALSSAPSGSFVVQAGLEDAAGERFSRLGRPDSYWHTVALEESGTYTVLALVLREWAASNPEFGGYETSKPWTERATVPITVTLYSEWSGGPLVWGVGFFFAIAAFAPLLAFWFHEKAKSYDGSVSPPSRS